MVPYPFRFLFCINKLNHSETQVYSRMNAVKSYFRLVLNRETEFDTVIPPKTAKKLPKVPSKQEVLRLFSVTRNPKHLLILKMAYGIGLRVGELIALKATNIDLDQSIWVRIEQNGSQFFQLPPVLNVAFIVVIMHGFG